MAVVGDGMGWDGWGEACGELGMGGPVGLREADGRLRDGRFERVEVGCG